METKDQLTGILRECYRETDETWEQELESTELKSYGEIMIPAKAPQKDGTGYQYPDIGHVVELDGKINQKVSCRRLLDSNEHRICHS